MESHILKYFCTMKDHRIDRSKMHSLNNIVFITIAATLCGAETWEEIEDFGWVKLDWFTVSPQPKTWI